jgi:hypothetical protein
VPVKGPFAFDHVSIGVNTLNDLKIIKKKLSAADFWVSEIVDHGFIYSIYSFDPNNIPIEFSYALPEKNVRTHPVLKDKNPSKTAMEGTEPRHNRWPSYEGPSDSDEDFKIYPGEGKSLFDN